MTYNPAINSYRCWQLAVAAMREAGVRAGNLPPLPDNPEEQRWAAEGPVPFSRLDTVSRQEAS